MESKEGRTQPCMLSTRARCWPQDRHTSAGERAEGAQQQPQQEGMLTPADSVRLPRFKERGLGGGGGASSQGTAAVPMITHSPQAGGVYEGFGNYYNHLLC